MRDGFVFYRSFLDSIMSLPEEYRYQTLLAICEYGCGEDPQVSGVPKAILDLAKPNIDNAIRNRENGRKGGRHKTSGCEDTKPVVSEDSNQWLEKSETSGYTTSEPVVNQWLEHSETSGYATSEPVVSEDSNQWLEKCASNVDVDEDIEVDGDKEKEKKEKPPLDSLIDDKDVADALSKWLDVRMQVGVYPYGSVTSCIDSCKQALAKYGKELCLAAIKEATDGAWKAIRWPKETARSGTTNKFAKMSNNQYDFDQLEKQLLKAQEV